MASVSQESLIVQAAQSSSLLDAALMYARLGMSVIPLKGKRPSLSSWTQLQQVRADAVVIHRWQRNGLLHNVGIVCGAASQNLVVLDTDGAASYPAFAAMFPKLAETYTVATGSGKGHHVYFYVEKLPESIKAMGLPIGNLELCANGRQVVAPPSLHPITGNPYRVHKALDILRVETLNELAEWIKSFKAKPAFAPVHFLPVSPHDSAKLNPKVMEEIERHFLRQGYREVGEWLHGPCIYPHRHQHGDRNPSFGFNRFSGFGSCFVCGTILAKDICAAVGIDVSVLGGLVEKSFNTNPHHQPTAVRLSLPPTEPPIPSETKLSSIALPPSTPPPSEPSQGFAMNDLKLPEWLKLYVEWAGATGNQTPLSFHLAAGLWLLSVAVGRRLYGAAPWGVKIFPNLYLMLIAATTYYRKSTAYKLAEGIAHEAIPHMLMPTPGSPERFQEALAGQLPGNFDKLNPTEQELFRKAQPFAAQRGLLKDEVAGLFGVINKRDYMVGMKDLLMELYDCPDRSSKETQAGVTIVEKAALSILGVTTPAGLAAGVSEADWANGLLVRFALITPETDYAERPAAIAFQSPPPKLIEGLRRLHERLPNPVRTERGLTPPSALQLDVTCWRECQNYGDHLRRLCAPQQDTELDERLKGVYGRLHVQAFKLATLMAALDWLDTDTSAPTLTVDHWVMGETMAETWRMSAHRLLEQMDRRGEASHERRQQDTLLRAIRQAGAEGASLRVLYRNLHLTAQRARLLAQELARAGLVVERRFSGIEWYVASEYATDETPAIG
ncbi:MAG: bifunctional DNA primase/polymerase [Chloroflexi bacterium]|nr:bifunctional DNA primase/polymerase [Chloroflexota bacterium]